MRDSWVETVLGELAEITTGSRAKGGAITSGIPSIGGEQIAEDRSIKFNKMKFIPKDHFESMRTGKLKFGDSLLVKDGATTGKVGYWGYDIPAAVNEHVFILRAKPDCAEPYFINLLISHRPFREEIESRTRGIIGGITRDIENIELVVPPLPEQKRIVDLISSVDKYIEALQQQLESAIRSRNAVLHELLTAGGDDWEESSLGRLLTLEYGKPLTDENRDGIGFPVFASAGVVGMHSEPLVSNSPVIVVGRKGTAGAVHWSSTPCFVIDTAYFVKPISDIDLRFLYLLLGFIDLKSVTAQTGVPGLNRDRAYSLKCNVPPKSMQLEVVAIVTQLDDFIDSTQGTINRSQDLRSGLLSDLLSGEHLIPSSYDKVMGAV